MRRSLPAFLLLMFASALAYADTTTGLGLKSYFTIPAGDQSVALLSKIFGEVGVSSKDFVLPGVQMGLMGTMFESFNHVMLALNSIVVGYAAVFGMISSAHEGEFLGKKFNSIWVPVRATAGIALLIPTASGYCMLQVIMMWIVLQGVGAGDHIWDSVITYISQNQNAPHFVGAGAGDGSFVAGSGPNAGIHGSTTNTLTFQAQQKAQAILTNLICMHFWYLQDNPKATSSSDKMLPYALVTTNASANTSTTTLYFSPYKGTSSTGQTNSQCGTVSFTNNYDKNGVALSPPTTASSTNSYAKDYYQQQAFTNLFYNSSSSGYVSKTNQFWQAANLAAKALIYQGYVNAKAANSPMNTSYYTDIFTAGTQPIPVLGSVISKQVTNAEKQYITFIENGKASTSPLWTNAKNYGWAYAGTFFHQLSTYYKGATEITGKMFDSLTVAQPNYNVSNPSPYNKSQAGVFTSVLTSQGSGITPTLAHLNTSESAFSTGTASGTFAFHYLGDLLVYGFVDMLTWGHGILIDGKMIPDNSDPIVGLQHFGENIINATELMWFIVFIIMAIAIVGLGISSAVNPFVGVMFLLLKIFPIIMGFFGILFVTGLIYSVYIPLIPYIVYLFAVIGWFLAVIETMLASPLVAMGLTHPEGHEVYGRAEPAVMLMVNVFTRPSLMIFGLIGGMLLSRVGLDLLNNTFYYVVVSDQTSTVSWGHGSGPNTTDNKSYQIGPLQLVLYIIIYLAIVVEIINKSFSLIHVIPDAVLRWIGNQHQFGEYAQGERAISDKASSGAGKTAEGGLPGTGEKSGAGGMMKSLGGVGNKSGAKTGSFGANLAKHLGEAEKSKDGDGDGGGEGKAEGSDDNTGDDSGGEEDTDGGGGEGEEGGGSGGT